MSDLLVIKEQTVGEQLVGEQCASKLLVDLKQVYGRSVRIGGNLSEKHETVTNMRSKQEPILAIRCAQQSSERGPYGATARWPDGRMDGWTDTPSHRDATAHLKRKKGNINYDADT